MRRHPKASAVGSTKRPRGGILLLLAIACVLVLAVAPVQASASLGVDTYWGSPDGGAEQKGGRFSTTGPLGVAVYEATGDVYTADTGFNRIQQFDANGNFIRAWGFDVSNPAASPEASATFEICTEKIQCKKGVVAGTALGGQLSNPAGIAVNQANGHVYVSDVSLNRIQEFEADGTFVRAFGQDVVQSGKPEDGGTVYEVCTTAANCKVGTTGTTNTAGATGGVLSAPGFPALAPTGTPNAGKLLVADPNRSRVQEFTAAGAFVRTFGAGVATAGAEGTGNVTATGSEAQKKTITGVATTKKAFLVGQTITGPGIPPGTVITAAPAASTLSLSKEATATAAGAALVVAEGAGNQANNERQQVTLPATSPSGSFFKLTFTAPNPQIISGAQTSANIPFNATAAEVQTALANLPNVGAPNISVTLAPGGDPGGGVQRGGPWIVEFIGKFADTNVGLLGAAAGTPVSTDPTAANSSSRTVLIEGASAFEVCTVAADCQASLAGSQNGQFASGTPTRVAEDSNGNIYTVEATGTAAGTPPVATSGYRVQKFTLPGNVVTPQGPLLCATLCGSENQKNNPIDVAADGQGMVYVAKRFPIGKGEPPAELVIAGQFAQSRILKIDPSANSGLGQVVEGATFNVNTGGEPGIEGDPSPELLTEGVSGLAPTAAGKPFYVTTAFAQTLAEHARSRVYRFDEISGPSGSISTTAVGTTAVTLAATIEPADTLGPVKTLYRIEYRREGTTAWISTPPQDVSIGNGSAGGESSECTDQLQKAICHFSAEVDGLELGRTYQYRLIARTSYRGSVLTTPTQEFTTEAVPPSVTTGGALWGGPPSTNPSLTFTGQINSQGGNTNYAFEYVTEADYAASQFAKAQIAPAAPISAGHGAKTLDVVVPKNGLDPNSEYKFRLVAGNPAGTSTGAVGSVAASHAGERFIELVSEGDSQGANVNSAPAAYGGTGLTVSDDGERAAFTALTFGSDQQAAPFTSNPAIAQRGTSGWTAAAVGGDPNGDASGSLGNSGSIGNSEVTQRLWGIAPEPQTVQWAVRKLDGSLTPISPLLAPLDRTGFFGLEFRGGSNDLSTLVLSGGPNGDATLFAGEPLLQGDASNLYKISGAGSASPSVSLLNRADGGGVIGGACGATLGSSGVGPKTNAVSADGSVVYFSARAGAPAAGTCDTTVPLRIFKRIGDASAIEVSACAKTPPGTCLGGSDFFWGASADGSRVLFTTARQLTDTDTDSTNDLYVYDESLPAPERLIQASAGEVVSTDHPTIGAGADVQGVTDFAMDGSRVYFVAKGRLTAEATANANNLYVFERDAAHPSGRIEFVAVLGDPDLWTASSTSLDGYKRAYALPRYEGEGAARHDGDGHLFLFTSNLPLLPAEDLDTSRDLYRYDDETGQLACLSCAGDKALPVTIPGRDFGSNMPDQVQRERVASEDGSKVVFRTSEQLLPVDTNTAEDAYLWDEGTLSLVSGATAGTGVSYPGGGGPAISPDGRSVFFATDATLLPQDLDNGATDIYAARVDGGFRQEDIAVACSSEDACRTAVAISPPQAQSPGSSSFTGTGNVKNKKCAKKKVLRNGKCVPKHKKPKHKQGKHKNSGKGKNKSRAGSGRGAGR